MIDNANELTDALLEAVAARHRAPTPGQSDYAVGDVIGYRSYGPDSIRTVVVTAKHQDIEGTGQPGFDGVLMEPEFAGATPAGASVWGYDSQVLWTSKSR